MNGSPVATKLTARLSPAEMHQDVWFAWEPFSERKSHLFSRAGSWVHAVNWGTGAFVAGLFVAWVSTWGRGSRRRWPAKLTAGAASLGIVVVGAVYLALPKTEVRLVKSPSLMAEQAVLELYTWLQHTNAVTRVEISAEPHRVVANPTNAASWVRHMKDAGGRGWDNFLLGGDIREEDSPGNFTLRETGDELEFVAYDAQGAEHVLNWTWQLRRQQR